jgi:hypothetical protein
MNRVYKLKGKGLIVKGSEDFLITNGFGGYFSYNPNSNYTGWYLLDAKNWKMQKIIESINPLNVGNQIEVHNNFSSIKRVYEKGEDEIIVHNNTLLYQAQKLNDKIKLTLDGREIYENSELGRNYNISIEENYTIISFDKNGLDKHYIVLKGIKDVKILNNWYEKNYSEDEKRNSQSKFWVCDAIEFSAKSYVVMAFSHDLKKAKTRADISFLNFDEIINSKNIELFEMMPNFDNIKDRKLFFASNSAFWSMNNLTTSFSFDYKILPGFYAGLPWFFQIWSRDELIMLGGLLSTSNYVINLPIVKSINPKLEEQNHSLILLKQILSRHINNIDIEGKLENRFPKSGLDSIDAFGWLGKRVYDFITLLQKKKVLFNYLTLDELKSWHENLYSGLSKAKENYGKQGLFANAFCETWMDTAYNDEGRFGYSIEIQALFLTIYDSLILLSKIIDSDKLKSLTEERNIFLTKIQTLFVQKNYSTFLIDRLYPEELKRNTQILNSAKEISKIPLTNLIYDKVSKPNVFLAHYLAKDILTKKDWEKVFDNAIEKLYLSWGGFSTIDKNSGLFQPFSTGHNNKSYHRGDSWYFLNNISAICLYDVNKIKYRNEIVQILSASTKDILEQGFLGNASEISSANAQDSSGTKCQGWSASTFLELVELLNSK